MAKRSGRRGRIELVDEPHELFSDGGVVVVGMLADEVDHFAIAVGGLSGVAARLMHHSEAVPAVMHVGETDQKVTCGCLGLVEPVGADEVHDGIGGGIKLVLIGVFLLGHAQARGDLCRQLIDGQGMGRGALMAMSDGGLIALRMGFDKAIALGRLVLGETALLIFIAAAAVAGLIASGLWGGFGHGGRHRRGGEDASLYRDLLADATFHQLLLACDTDLAEAVRAGRCGLCGGALHSACYLRKPRGRPCRLGPEHDRRFSFCCAVDGCRSRATPPSLRFLGRKVYLAAVVVLVAILRHGVTTSRIDRLSQVVGVDRRTVERWRAWWRERFPITPFWQVARAAFMPPIDRERLPASLLERFTGDDADRLVALLRFIGPVTGSCVHAR
jgi:hypothetical protein